MTPEREALIRNRWTAKRKEALSVFGSAWDIGNDGRCLVKSYPTGFLVTAFSEEPSQNPDILIFSIRLRYAPDENPTHQFTVMCEGIIVEGVPQ